MNNLGFIFALIFAKVSYLFLKITKLSSGTSIIGKFVLKICPCFLTCCNRYIKTKLNVTGTNGKTTTSGLISHLIKSDNNMVINNAKGANMLNGVVNAIAVYLNPLRKVDFSVIESDEAYLAKIYEQFDADYLVITNLFRDQLDRYGELTTTKRLIQDGINKKDNIKLLLNADDPLVASFEAKNIIYYGIEKVVYNDGIKKVVTDTEEAFNCINCNLPLKYSEKFFAQQGHYHCNCGYKRPEVKYSAVVNLFSSHSEVEINGRNYYVPLVGLFNAYNAIAAISLCLELGIKNIQENLKTFEVAFGRSEVKILNGHETLIQLIKNPIGTTEALKTVDLNSNILIAINDNYADGRDVSWLWDAKFEFLKDVKKQIVTSGIRAHDMALRLKYAGVSEDKIKIMPILSEAIDYVGNNSENKITILPTYTALLEIDKNKHLKKK